MKFHPSKIKLNLQTKLRFYDTIYPFFRNHIKKIITDSIAYCILGSPKEGYLSRDGKLKPTLLSFPPISHPPSGLKVDPREPSGVRNNDTSG